jgi:transcriptional regulator with PAS, ATPase and Fis domain
MFEEIVGTSAALKSVLSRISKVAPRHFVQQFAQRMNKTISAISSETMDVLARYPWPGNIRELQNVVERSMNIDKYRFKASRSRIQDRFSRTPRIREETATL